MQLAISVAGAAIGFAMGGPMGAQWGWMAGSLVGTVLFPPHQEGPHMGDLKVQNSAYGVPIPIPYGMARLAGNVIWAADPVEHENTQGGKGPPSVTTYSYSESFAVGLCEGPILGVRRIWANGKLIYDMTPGASSSNVVASSFAALLVGGSQSGIRVYLGDETQTPDATMESILGVGNVSAYRGMAYVVFTDHDLSPYGTCAHRRQSRPPAVDAVATAVSGKGLWPRLNTGAMKRCLCWGCRLVAVRQRATIQA